MNLKGIGKVFFSLGFLGWVLIAVILISSYKVDAQDNDRDNVLKKMELFVPLAWENILQIQKIDRRL